eukprot:CAMPEP_0204274110 /NCGR_PEP_ID=MMETSP0468-20130131/24999_1 /ASSEMBLY_ACC=CAM_ASM_000383 /TAXON_ID=2969 /ORGANISM="Oxyrrhis marina" /LENGTH=191 /DNA_ID=CAMNT_0051250269 /DNA_START=29 /DNA_END=604 /DNA_ORIENTATION=+
MAAVSLEELIEKDTESERHIPAAVFIERVEEFIGQRQATDVLTALQELYQKYQLMQASMGQQKGALLGKLPDIVSCLSIVNHQIRQRDSDAPDQDVRFQLADQVYAKAKVPPGNAVCLWLGANVMLEYTLDEAKALLEKNEKNANLSLASLEEDMAFLRDQITTTEVNIARVHNFNVRLRQQQRAQAGEAK